MRKSFHATAALAMTLAFGCLTARGTLHGNPARLEVDRRAAADGVVTRRAPNLAAIGEEPWGASRQAG